MKKLAHFTFILFTVLILTACDSSNTGPRASLGNPDASVLIEEFSDFQCPACARVGTELEELVLNNPDIARLEFYHFPLSYHTNAFKAAEAAECANDQGKFWEYADILFENQKSLTEDNLKSFAANLGLGEEVFNECLDSGKKRSRIKADINEGMRRQLSYTPSLYVNGELVQWGGAEQFEAYLRSIAQ